MTASEWECPICGAALRAGDHFCTNCGSGAAFDPSVKRDTPPGLQGALHQDVASPPHHGEAGSTSKPGQLSQNWGRFLNDLARRVEGGKPRETRPAAATPPPRAVTPPPAPRRGDRPWNDFAIDLAQAVAGDYEIVGELGRGGMAVVYLAHDPRLQRTVAIKALLPSLAYDEQSWERFLTEARTSAQLEHPNIVGIHAVGETDRVAFIVMKFVDGRPLDDMIARHAPLPIPVALTILLDIARALQHAHHSGVVHRDVKPANVMIDQKGHAIVMDFGIARVQQQSTRHTQAGSVVGTPAYMSPEQARGLILTGASDQYSLGVLAYELFTGIQPFRGSAAELQFAHVLEDPRPIGELRKDLPPAVAGAVMRMLSKDPDDRWPSLTHFASEFGSLVDAEQDRARSHLMSMVRWGTARRAPGGIGARANPSHGGNQTTGRATPLASRTPITQYSVRHGQPARPSATQPPAAAAETASPRRRTAVVAMDSGVLVRRRSRINRVRGAVGGALAVASLLLAVRLIANSPHDDRRTDTAGASVVSATPLLTTDGALLGDSIALGHGAGAMRTINGEPPRVVSPDAVGLLVVRIGRSRLATGDTVSARLDAYDDAGERVTTQKVTWTTSDRRVVAFAGPGELVAVAPGRATVTVRAGSVFGAAEVEVGLRSGADPPLIRLGTEARASVRRE